jgi:hypothetical protein
MDRSCLVCCLLVCVLNPRLAVAQQSKKSNELSESAANPEMDRLAKALAGDWNTAESMVRSQFFPNGGSRHGRSHIRLVAAGTSLFAEFHSNGSAGKLDGLYVIWWDKPASIYRFFVCFNDSKTPCKLRGTAHWEGDAFVNDYEGEVDGKMTKWRDSFINITPNSHSLVAAMDAGYGTMKTLITTTSTRRQGP